MTTLNDLLDKTLDIYSKNSSGDIPIYVNGTPLNIELNIDKESNNRCFIDMTFNKKNV